MSLVGNKKKNIKMALLGLLCAICLFLSGCATVFGDNTRSIRVDSDPQGASIYVDGQQHGVTPAVVAMPTYIYGGKNISIRKEGYQDQSLAVTTRFQPVALINVFIWPGFIIDLATGNIVKIDPVNLNLSTKLQPVSQSVSQ